MLILCCGPAAGHTNNQAPIEHPLAPAPHRCLPLGRPKAAEQQRPGVLSRACARAHPLRSQAHAPASARGQGGRLRKHGLCDSRVLPLRIPQSSNLVMMQERNYMCKMPFVQPIFEGQEPHVQRQHSPQPIKSLLYLPRGCCGGATATQCNPSPHKTVLQVLVVEKEGTLQYERIFMFSHRAADATARHITLCTANATCLTATPGHYVYAAQGLCNWPMKLQEASFARSAELTRLGDVGIGDAVWALDAGSSLQPECVAKVAVGVQRGLYNPHTPSGTIVIGGMAAATFTDVLRPSVRWHTLITAPGRLLFDVLPTVEIAARVNAAMLRAWPSCVTEVLARLASCVRVS